MRIWENYSRPKTIQEALDTLDRATGEARVIAGGTDLLIDLQQGRHPPIHTLVDISALTELNSIELTEDAVVLGAGVTHDRIIHSPLLEKHAQCLVEACAVIGGPQVRNVATIGGNVAHGLPAADGTIALLALDAQAEIAAPGGTEWKPLAGLITGPGKTAFDRSRQILTRFRFPRRSAAEASAFARIMRPQGIAIAILNLACWLRREGDHVEACRLSLGPSGPRPRRLKLAEGMLEGKPLNRESQAAVRDAILQESNLRTSPHRATADYRSLLVQTLLERTLPRAYQMAGELEVDGA